MKVLISKYAHYLNYPLDDAHINQILVYIQNRQIKKLQYEYGNLLLLLSLKHCEDIEDFECCAAIKKFIQEVNRYSPNSIPENIEKWKPKKTI